MFLCCFSYISDLAQAANEIFLDNLVSNFVELGDETQEVTIQKTQLGYKKRGEGIKLKKFAR